MKGQPGFAIWFTGLPAAGKSTLARALADALAAQDVQTQILDSDELRTVLTPAPDYSPQERDWFYATVAYLAQLLTQNGVNVLVAATAVQRVYRDRAREMLPKFLEVYVRCSLETAMARDEKGTYEQALSGEASTVPGVQIPFEEPLDPEVVVDTELVAVELGVARVCKVLKEQNLIR